MSSEEEPHLQLITCTTKLGNTLVLLNNETGFQKDHVYSICDSANSTKVTLQNTIGEKGIGC